MVPGLKLLIQGIFKTSMEKMNGEFSDGTGAEKKWTVTVELYLHGSLVETFLLET